MTTTILPNTLRSYPPEDPIMVAIREKLSLNLKTGFIGLIPQEVFDQMTDLAIDEFVNGSQDKRFKIESPWMRGDDSRNPTGKDNYVQIKVPKADYNVVMDKDTLPGMIYLEIVNLAKANINKALSEDPNFQSTYDQQVGHQITPVIEKIVSDNAGAFVQALMSNIVNFTLVNSINTMRQSNGMGNYIPHIHAPKF